MLGSLSLLGCCSLCFCTHLDALMFVGEICCGRLLYDEMMLAGDEPLSTAMAIGGTFVVLSTAEQMTDDNHELNLTVDCRQNASSLELCRSV